MIFLGRSHILWAIFLDESVTTHLEQTVFQISSVCVATQVLHVSLEKQIFSVVPVRLHPVLKKLWVFKFMGGFVISFVGKLNIHKFLIIMNWIKLILHETCFNSCHIHSNPCFFSATVNHFDVTAEVKDVLDLGLIKWRKAICTISCEVCTRQEDHFTDLGWHFYFYLRMIKNN